MTGRIRRLVAAARERRSLGRCGFGIRQDWPDGSHVLSGIWPSYHAAERAARRDHAYWRPGPLRPLRWRIVVATRFEVRTHHRPGRSCLDTTCPTGPVIIGRAVPGQVRS